MVSADVQVQLTVNTSGQILGFNIPEDVYMRDYAEDFCEWIDGTVVKMSPVHDRHDLIVQHFVMLFRAYFELRPIGELRHQPFVMRLEFEQDGKTKRRNREPDLQLILNENLDKLKPTYMDGAADIVIEVVSPESASRDYGEKFHEYEQAGVPEYWIIDSIKKECRFYRLTAKKAYLLHEVEGSYTTPQLPKLVLHIPTLWQDPMPGTISIGKVVQEMLED
jgi:Uma2 family endonuclease